MLRLFLLLIFGLLPIQAKADISFICPQSGLRLQNITCCELPYSACLKTIEARIPETLRNGVSTFMELYDQNYFSIGTTPNCHWASKNFHKPLIDNFYQVDPGELLHYLERNFRPLPSVMPPEAGDIIYFSFESEGAGLINADFQLTQMHGMGFRSGYFDHSSIYLGENLVLQKENAFSDVFSIADLESVRKTYENDIRKTYGLTGRLRWEAWRRAN